VPRVLSHVFWSLLRPRSFDLGRRTSEALMSVALMSGRIGAAGADGPHLAATIEAVDGPDPGIKDREGCGS